MTASAAIVHRNLVPAQCAAEGVLGQKAPESFAVLDGTVVLVGQSFEGRHWLACFAADGWIQTYLVA
jgi:hypothetical protein